MNVPNGPNDYSARRAMAGSMRAARLAGTTLARSIDASRTAVAAANAAGSMVEVPYNLERITIETAAAPAIPIAHPTIAVESASRRPESARLRTVPA